MEGSRDPEMGNISQSKPSKRASCSAYLSSWPQVLRMRQLVLQTNCPKFLGALLLLSIGVCGATWAQTPGAPATLSGQVLDSVTRRPIARVLVDSPTGNAGLLTDRDGRFTFPDVPLGSVTIRYHRPGYFDPLTAQPYASRTLTLTGASTDQVLLLDAAGSLSGTLQLPDGESPDGLRVDLLAEQVTDGRRHWQRERVETVHSDGSFHFDDLRAGSYLLHGQGSLDPAPFGAPVAEGLGYVPVWAPRASEIRSATVYTLRPGQSEQVQLTMERAPYYPVTIRVTGDAPARFFRVTGNAFLDWGVRFQSREGIATTNLPSGSYVLHAGGGRNGSGSDLPFRVEGAPVSGLVLAVVDPGARQDDSSGAAPNGSGSTPSLNSLTFLPANAPEQSVTVQGVRFDSSTGTATLRGGLPAGQYWVSTSGVSGGYITSFTSGGVDLLREPLTVAPGSLPTFQVIFRQDAGTVSIARSGVLLDQACAIQLVPLDPGGLAADQVAMSAGDTTVFSDVPPGNYLLLATAANRAIAFREPGVVQQLTGLRITVAAGEQVQTTLSQMFIPPAGSPGVF